MALGTPVTQFVYEAAFRDLKSTAAGRTTAASLMSAMLTRYYSALHCVFNESQNEESETRCLLAESAMLAFVGFFIVLFYTKQTGCIFWSNSNVLLKDNFLAAIAYNIFQKSYALVPKEEACIF